MLNPHSYATDIQQEFHTITLPRLQAASQNWTKMNKQWPSTTTIDGESLPLERTVSPIQLHSCTLHLLLKPHHQLTRLVKVHQPHLVTARLLGHLMCPKPAYNTGYRSIIRTLLFGPKQFLHCHPDIFACPSLPLDASNLSHQASLATVDSLLFGTVTHSPPAVEHLLVSNHCPHAPARYLQQGRRRILTCRLGSLGICLCRCDAVFATPAVTPATPSPPRPLRPQRVPPLPRLIPCPLLR